MRNFRTDERGVFAVEFALLMPLCLAALGWAIDIGQTMQMKQATQFAALASASVGGRSLNQQGGAIAAATLAAQKTFTANATLFMAGATPTLGTIQAYDASGVPTTQDAAATSIDVTVSASAAPLFPFLVPTIVQSAEARS
jgi:Flp pilus assembly protein TadG